MSGFYKLKQILETYYREYGTYMEAAARFLIAFVLFLQINGRIGKSSPLGNIFTELILALICAVLPPNAMVLLTALMALAQFAATSILTLAVGGGILILLLLLYLTFARGEAWALLLTMTGLFFHMPCIVPVGFGLVGSPLSAAGIAVGTIFYYVISVVADTGQAEVQLAMAHQNTEETLLSQMQNLQRAILQEQEMILMLIVLLAVFTTVFFVRKMAMKYAWKVAIACGTLIYLVLMVAGCLMLKLEIGILWILAGTVLCVPISILLEELFFALDYRHIEKLQFEDKNYYYYVQAVPKKHQKEDMERTERKGREYRDEHETIHS